MNMGWHTRMWAGGCERGQTNLSWQLVPIAKKHQRQSDKGCCQSRLTTRATRNKVVVTIGGVRLCAGWKMAGKGTELPPSAVVIMATMAVMRGLKMKISTKGISLNNRIGEVVCRCSKNGLNSRSSGRNWL